MAERQTNRSADYAIDGIDVALLHALKKDARAPIGELSKAAGASRATVYARLARLRAEGVIDSLTVTVDPKRVGHTVSAVVLLRSTTDAWKQWSSIAPLIEEMPEVEYAADIAGEFDILLLLRLRDVEHLQRFITEDLRPRIPGIAGVRTFLVLNQVPERSLVLPSK